MSFVVNFTEDFQSNNLQNAILPLVEVAQNSILFPNHHEHERMCTNSLRELGQSVTRPARVLGGTQPDVDFSIRLDGDIMPFPAMDG